MRDVESGDAVDRVYYRQLPGGGYVAIEVTPAHDLAERQQYRGDVVVERRGDSARREGHVPPIIASRRAALVSTIVHGLFPVAQSNTAIATRLAGRMRSRRAGDRGERLQDDDGS